MMFGMPGMGELLVIFAIVTLLFGGSFLPKFFKGLGEGVREAKKVGKELNEAVKEIEQ
jgi:sec-independent protein translocase protein TatA